MDRFRLVPKVYNDIAVIYMQTKDEVIEVGRILLPQDNQLSDTMDMINKITNAMKERYKRSI